MAGTMKKEEGEGGGGGGGQSPWETAVDFVGG